MCQLFQSQQFQIRSLLCISCNLNKCPKLNLLKTLIHFWFMNFINILSFLSVSGLWWAKLGIGNVCHSPSFLRSEQKFQDESHPATSNPYHPFLHHLVRPSAYPSWKEQAPQPSSNKTWPQLNPMTSCLHPPTPQFYQHFLEIASLSPLTTNSFFFSL